jgi:hypothetical protein
MKWKQQPFGEKELVRYKNTICNIQNKYVNLNSANFINPDVREMKGI